MPGIYVNGLYDLNARWLNNMRITWVPMVAPVIATFIHIGLCILFVSVWDFGINGIAYAHLITDTSMFILIMCYIPFIS